MKLNKIKLKTEQNKHRSANLRYVTEYSTHLQGQSVGAMSFRHGVFVVATNGGVFVFNGTGQWQRPTILRPAFASPVKCIRQSKGHVALVDSAAIHVFANNGT